MSKSHLASSIFGDDAAGHEPRPGHGTVVGDADGVDGVVRADAGQPGGRDSGGGGAPGGHSSPPLRRQQHRHRRRHRRRRGSRRLLVLLVTVVVVAVASLVAVQGLRPLVAQLTASKDYTGDGSGSAVVVVHAGDSGRTIGVTLQEAGVVKTSKAFADVAAADPRAGSIQPGSYRLHQRMSAAAALAMLLDPKNRTVPRAVIREGLWKSEVFTALSRATGQPVSAYVEAARNPAQLGLPAAAKGNLEGYLFPATYEFEAGASAATQLRTMVTKAVGELQSLGVQPADMQRVVTIASIVEGESSRPQDRAKVARVIYNRLAKRMLLQMDSTVHYLAQARGLAGTSNAQRAVKSPYNTYVSAGLPPGPIDSPGLASMQAAIRPAPGPWLYFVTVNPQTGDTRFAATAPEHQVNVKLFNQWCTAHKGKC